MYIKGYVKPTQQARSLLRFLHIDPPKGINGCFDSFTLPESEASLFKYQHGNPATPGSLDIHPHTMLLARVTALGMVFDTDCSHLISTLFTKGERVVREQLEDSQTKFHFLHFQREHLHEH